MGKSRKTKIIILTSLLLILFIMSGCVPSVKLYKLEILSQPDAIGVVILERIEQTSFEETDVRLTPLSVNVKPNDKVILQVVSEEPRGDRDEIHTFDRWSDGSIENPKVVTVSSNMKLEAITKTKFKISVSSAPTKIVTIPGSGWYDEGKELSLTAPELEGYRFVGWKVDEVIVTDNPLALTVTSPKRIEAVYDGVSSATLTLASDPIGLKVELDSVQYTAPASVKALTGTSHTLEFSTQERDESDFVEGKDTKYFFRSWNDSNTVNPREVTLDSDATYTALAGVEYLVQISTLPEGVAKIDGAGWKSKDSFFSLQSHDLIEYEFSHWLVNGIRTDAEKLNVKIDSPKKIVAVYSSREYSFSVNTEPAELEVVLKGARVKAPVSVVARANETISLEAVTPQGRDESDFIGGIDAKHTFLSWSDSNTASAREVTVNENISLTARFKSEYLVSVSSSVASITDGGWFEKGKEVNLTPPEVENYSFLNWLVNGEVVESKNLALTVQGPVKIEAVYRRLGTYTLTVETTPSGLEVLLDGVVEYSPAVIEVLEGTSHTFQVTPSQERDQSSWVEGNDSKYTFTVWSDGNTSAARSVTVNSSLAFKADTKAEYYVQVYSREAAISGSGWYEKGGTLTVAAPEVEGKSFSGWFLNGELVYSQRSLSVTVDKPLKAEARYLAKASYTLSLNTDPENFELLVDGVQYTSPTLLSFQENSEHSLEALAIFERDQSEFVEGKDARYNFFGWSDGLTSNAREIILDKDMQFTAQYTPEYRVEVCCDSIELAGSGWYADGVQATFSARAIEGHNFLNWQMNGEDAGGGTTLKVVVNAPISLKAFYNAFPTLFVPDGNLTKGEIFSLELSQLSNDPDGDELTYSLISGPGSITGTLYTLDSRTLEAGLYEVAIGTSDGRGGTASDTFTLGITASNNPPTVPNSPSPVNGACEQATTTVLHWECSDLDGDALTYELYFGSSSTPAKILSGLETNSHSIEALEEGTTYYWRVQANDTRGGKSEGPLWSFTTARSETIEPDPVDGVDIIGPSYTGNVLLVNNESLNSYTKAYSGTLSSQYLPSGENLPVDLPLEAYALNMEIPLPEGVTLDQLVKPSQFETAALGDTMLLWAYRFTDNAPYQITATLQYAGSECEVWVENTSEITLEKAAQLGEEFDEVIYPLVAEYFYAPSDVDGNGRVKIFCFDIQDNFSTTGAYIGGYFSSGDLFNGTTSNRGEIFYIDTYPTMHYPRDKAIDVGRAFSTLAHEFQHMVNFNRNYLVENGYTMPSWLNEGLSMAAEHLYKGVLYSRISYYNSSTNIKNGHSLLRWGDNGDVLSNYSLSYLFAQYIRSLAGDDSIFKDILLDSQNDYNAVINALEQRGISKDFGQLMTSFRLALLLKNDSGPYGFAGETGFEDLSTKLYTGSAKDLVGGSAFFKAIAGSFSEPGDQGATIRYAGVVQ